MRAFTRISVLLLALAVPACALLPVVPVEGSKADLADLSGEWLGWYTNPDFGRRGTIWFKLVPGETFAHGDVRMTPHGKTTPYTEYDPMGLSHQRPLQFLDIRFVRVSATEVTGELDQYWDPDNDCTALTVFRGELRDGRLRGSFETRLATGTVVTGRWEATRQPGK